MRGRPHLSGLWPGDLDKAPVSLGVVFPRGPVRAGLLTPAWESCVWPSPWGAHGGVGWRSEPRGLCPSPAGGACHPLPHPEDIPLVPGGTGPGRLALGRVLGTGVLSEGPSPDLSVQSP